MNVPHQESLCRECCALPNMLAAGGARREWLRMPPTGSVCLVFVCDYFSSAPQLKRHPLGGATHPRSRDMPRIEWTTGFTSLLGLLSSDIRSCDTGPDAAPPNRLEAGGARRLGNESFFSASQRKRDRL